MIAIKEFKDFVTVLCAFFVSTSCYSKSNIVEQIKPSIRPELKEHTKIFKKKIYQVAGNIYCAVGWHIANTIIIEG